MPEILPAPDQKPITGWRAKLTRDRVLYGASIIVGALSVIAAFAAPAGAWPLVVLALVCVGIANLDRFSEVSASASGVKGVLKEAKAEVAQVREIVELMSEYQLSNMQQLGRWGGTSEDAPKQLALQRLTDLMRRAGVPETRVKEIKATSWDRYVLFDYVIAITGGALVPKSTDPAIEARWRTFRDFYKPAPTVAALTAFLDEVGDTNPLRRELLASYEHYRQTGEHLDAWAMRDKVPQLLGERTL